MRKVFIFCAGCVAVSVSAQVNWNEIPPGEGTFRDQAGEFRSDTIEIPLDAYGELEYKLGIEEGAAIVYEWDVVDMENPDLLYAEFHGHTEPVDGTGDLMFYRKAEGGSEQGSLVAPFSGIHGWYLVNGSDSAVVVRLRVAGYYDLLPQ